MGIGEPPSYVQEWANYYRERGFDSLAPYPWVVADLVKTWGSEEAFIAASLDNCKNSIKEAGVTRFDLMQNTDDSANFALVEVYNTANAPAAHKATAHYAAWAAAVKRQPP